jgi:hypothetical protein
MNEINKQRRADSIDVIISGINGLNIAWGLSKAMYGAGLKIRQRKAFEWVEMVRDNPGVFTQKILMQEEFQDGFVFALEKYIIERNGAKRKYFRNIFLGYANASSRLDFQLEKFIHTLSQVSVEDIDVLGDVDRTNFGKNYQIYGNETKNISNIHNLINLGILHSDPSSRIGKASTPFVWLSDFGRDFIEYIKAE